MKNVIFGAALSLFSSISLSNSMFAGNNENNWRNENTDVLVSEQISFTGKLIIEGQGNGWWEGQNTAVVICRGIGICVEIDFDKKTL